MRIFRKYSPALIAKHVASFFKGQFKIEDQQGTFVFDGGKVIIDENCSESQRKIGKEVNKIIAGFLSARRSQLRYD